MKLRSSFLALSVLAIVPTVLFAQSSDGDISRTSDGRILHRRSPEPGDAPVADTPVFVYDPDDTERSVPKDLVRDGTTLPRPSPSTEASNGEPIHTAKGLAKPPATPPENPPPGPAEPLPAPGPDAVNDPSAPFSPVPPAPSIDLDALQDPSADAVTVVDNDIEPSGDAVEGDGGPLPDGADGASPGGEGPADDPRAGLGNEARPDRDTEREGTLHYNEVFDPSIVPFKRNRALDVIGDDLTLHASEGRMERLEPVGNRVERGREVFWGSLLLSGDAGERIPIPSVSPEGNILSYQANPPQDIRFERDQAGNFYATPSLEGRVRLVFVTDAPAHWFGRGLPLDARFDQVPRALRPKVPKAIQREALEVAAVIGIPAGADYSATLERLVAWFREFEPGEPPPAQGSIYRDIALGKKGICRHRSHAFVVTAQSLGIPAHYVFNEAHVFVEVYIPGEDAGWLRIDLGGGADELQVHGAEGKSLHQPLTNDPFEKPPAFADSEAAGATRVEGMPASGETEASGNGPSNSGAATTLEGPIVRARPAPSLEPTRTTIAASQSLVFRGDALRITGQVATLRGAPIGAGTVQILLTTGAEREAIALLGTATLAGGRFEVDVSIPVRQSPGHYEIVAEFVGDGVNAPSIGE